MGQLDTKYIELIRNVGNPPTEITALEQDHDVLEIFLGFVQDQGKEDLSFFAGVLGSLILHNVSADDLWPGIESGWEKHTGEVSLNDLLEDDQDRRIDLVSASFAKLNSTYVDTFLPAAKEALSHSETGEQGEDEGDELERLLGQLAVEVKDKKVNTENFVKSLDIKAFSVDESELDKLLEGLTTVDVSNRQSIAELRRSSSLDMQEVERLLSEIDDINSLDQEEESVERMLEDLLDFSKVVPREQIVQKIDDLPDTPVTKEEVEDIFKWVDEYIEARTEQDKNLKVKEMVVNDDFDTKDLELRWQELEKLLTAGDDEVPDQPRQQAPSRPSVTPVKLSQWQAKTVGTVNKDALDNAADGGSVAVIVGAGVALFGSEWSTSQDLAGYTASFDDQYSNDDEYAASGKVERGVAVVQKSTSIFNPGKVTFQGINEAANIDAIKTAMKLTTSKKKVSFA